jgi:hypothetical protein
LENPNCIADFGNRQIYAMQQFHAFQQPVESVSASSKKMRRAVRNAQTSVPEIIGISWQSVERTVGGHGEDV